MPLPFVRVFRDFWEGSNPGRVRPDDLLDFENRISSHPFMDAPLGASLNDLMAIEFLNAAQPWGLAMAAKDVAAYIWHTAASVRPMRPRLDESIIDSNRGKVLCTWISRRPQFERLILPVVRHLGSNNVLILGSDRRMSGGVPSGFSFVARGDVPCAPIASWYPRYIGVTKWWAKEISEFVSRQNMPRWILPRVHGVLLIAAQRFAAYRAFLETLRPAAVLTEYDRNTFAAPLILAARSLGIQTFTLVHGMINGPFGYTPLVADRVFAWGNRGKDTLMEYGVDADRIEVAGHPALDRANSSAHRREILEGVGLPPDRPVVLLATNPINHDSRRRFAESFCGALHDNGDVSLIVRLHPSEKPSFYEPLRAVFPRVIFLENSRWNLDESLAAADIVVCHNSGYALDAMVKRRPVVVLDTIPEPLLGTEAIIVEGGCPVARSSRELADTVDRVLSDKAFCRHITDRADRFIGSTYETLGDEAAARIARSIKNSVRNGMRRA